MDLQEISDQENASEMTLLIFALFPSIANSALCPCRCFLIRADRVNCQTLLNKKVNNSSEEEFGRAQPLENGVLDFQYFSIFWVPSINVA